MRRKSVWCAAVALLVAGAYALGQGRRDEPPAPYRAVLTIEAKPATGKLRDRFIEIPLLSEALNNLDAEGYDSLSVTPMSDDRYFVVARKRR